jgi:pilus assembly protein Flp/PilA
MGCVAGKVNIQQEKSMQNRFLKLYVKAQSLMREERGQDMIEYILVAALIALGATAGMQGLASSLNTAFNQIGSKLTTYTS